MARHYFPGLDPIGRRMDVGRGSTGGQIEIIGIAARRALQGPAHCRRRAMLYLPAMQREPEEAMVFAVRTSGDAASQAHAAIRRGAGGGCRPCSPRTSRRWRSVRDERLVNERLLAMLSASFGALALLLAAVGVYGVVAYSVSMRTSEFGLRAALGASRRTLLWLGLRGSMALVVIAVAVGAAGAFLASSLIAGLLFQVRPAEPWIYATTALVLLGVALVAAIVPTYRASRVDPAMTLRWL